jgi:hypothetical protein
VPRRRWHDTDDDIDDDDTTTTPATTMMTPHGTTTQHDYNEVKRAKMTQHEARDLARVIRNPARATKTRQ